MTDAKRSNFRLPSLIHVAAADESRGRVLIVLTDAEPDMRATTAAADLAHAYGASIEALFVEDAELFRAAAYGFVRQVMLSGTIASSLQPEALSSDVYGLRQAALSTLERQLQTLGAYCKKRAVRDDFEHAIAAACLENGPWNMLVLGNTAHAGNLPLAARILDITSDLTGVWIASDNPGNTEGPIVVVLETDENFPQLMRAAERLQASRETDNAKITVLILAPPDADSDQLEGRIRLAVASMTTATSIPVTLDLAPTHTDRRAALVLSIKRLKPRAAIASIPILIHEIEEHSNAPITIPCPVLLVR